MTASCLRMLENDWGLFLIEKSFLPGRIVREGLYLVIRSSMLRVGFLEDIRLVLLFCSRLLGVLIFFYCFDGWMSYPVVFSPCSQYPWYIISFPSNNSP